jgi:hypothetical protein
MSGANGGGWLDLERLTKRYLGIEILQAGLRPDSLLLATGDSVDDGPSVNQQPETTALDGDAIRCVSR